MRGVRKIALVGNPNVGKTSLFNLLTGLNQKVGNFSGVTVEKKSGLCELQSLEKIEIIDLPGTYSLNPKSEDEFVVTRTLLNPKDDNHPDAILFILDASNLKRNLLLLTQIIDLEIPTIVAINMNEIAIKAGVHIDIQKFEKTFKVKAIEINARSGEGIDNLKQLLSEKTPSHQSTLYAHLIGFNPKLLSGIQTIAELPNPYYAYLLLEKLDQYAFITEAHREQIKKEIENKNIDFYELHKEEIITRYQYIEDKIKHTTTQITPQKSNLILLSRKIDTFLLHPILGYFFFLLVLLIVFQTVFSLSSYPMDLIDGAFTWINDSLKSQMPDTWYTSFLTDGVIAGINGIVIFVPQIALLFVLLSILEESGYMARVMFLTDKIFRFFGLNGRSVVPMVSAVACAIPAIMATRSISNYKDRLITILVTPLISCSARLPVYAILISLVVPDEIVFGFITYQGIAFLMLYLLGFVMAMVVAWVFNWFIKVQNSGFFVMELPQYRLPRIKNMKQTLFTKTKAFVWDAGKIILFISILLWFLGAFGPEKSLKEAEIKTEKMALSHHFSAEEKESYLASAKLEASYIGQFGKIIEPAIKPLGYDWKIGIAIISSFAAREVFVGTISTLYHIGDEGDTASLTDRMKAEKDSFGKPIYTIPTVFSLLVFYALSMQCMSTLAIVRRETGSWKWPMVQLVYMTTLAWLAAWVVYISLV